MAQTLAAGWIGHFYSADRSIKWKKVETEHSLWLDDNTLLLGRIDAEGKTEDGEAFYADWKTISAKNKNKMGSVKAEYKLDPQMLTYGLLTQQSKGNRFMVRWAMKPDKYLPTPLYFYEWYSYNDAEVAWWRNMVLNISAKIRFDRIHLRPFITNLTNCLRYGANYACPHLAEGCSKQNWDVALAGLIPRVSHLEIERKLMARDPGSEHYPDPDDLVVLDATRIDTWLGCNERFRREYIGNPHGYVAPPGEALAVGIEFHDLLHSYYNELKEKQCTTP